MSISTLDDFMALNDQLAALHGAGVSLDAGLGLAGDDVTANLMRINAVVARRVSQGQSVIEALEVEDPALSPTYRSLMQAGLQSGDWAVTLHGYRRLSQSIDRSWHAVLLGLLYPLVVCGLAYLGLIGFCIYLVPTLENLYVNLGLRPAAGLRVVQGLRDAMPYWGAFPFVGLICYFGGRWRIRVARSKGGYPEARAWALLPGMSRAVHLQRCANFAETLAMLIDSGASLDRGVRIAAGACGDASLTSAAREVADSLAGGGMIGADSAAAQTFPPFLRWALWDAPATMGRPQALRMAASVYRESAERRMERLSVVAPLVACAAIGGSATLFYGLALFVPVVQLLEQLAS